MQSFLPPQQILKQATQTVQKGNFSLAHKHFTTLSKIDPQNASIQLSLARCSFELCDLPAMQDHARRAMQLAQGNAPQMMKVAAFLERTGENDLTLAAYSAAAKADPKLIAAKAGKAHVLQSLARFSEAEEILRKLLKKHPDHTDLFRMYLSSKKLKKGDPLIRQMQTLWKNPRLNAGGRLHLGFALAKAMEDSGQPERVFSYLTSANAAQKSESPFDRQARVQEQQSYLSAQPGPFPPLSEAPPALTPIFVSGMPRSGTTLIEQTIARHSQVTAGGELGHALRLAPKHLFENGEPRALSDLSKDALDAWGADHQALLARDTRADTPYVTDKGIMTHLMFGAIHQLIPQARFVVVHRDPRDIALSIYKNHFAPGTHRYANDLADIAFAIKQFRHCIAYWRETMPGVIHEVQYEEFVSNPQAQTRALIDAIGLDWEDACLNSGATAGVVKTLSLAQVRQPIHTGRTQAWRKYEQEMQPFIDAWGDEPWD